MSDNIFLVVALLIYVVIAIIYVIPSYLAFRRSHPNRWLILVINLAFGGTIIGWGVALVWALRAAHRSGEEASGGESGLNLFVNDVKRVQIEPPPLPSLSEELERLHGLLDRGAIDRAEYDGLKAKLIGGRT